MLGVMKVVVLSCYSYGLQGTVKGDTLIPQGVVFGGR